MKTRVFAVCVVVFLFCGITHAGLSDGLVAYYPFNGNANDESGNGNNGTVNGATLTTDRFGNANKAYSFGGERNYISIADSTGISPTSAITLSAWVNPNSFGPARRILSKCSNSDCANNAYILSLANDKIYFQVSRTQLYSTSVSANEWVYITETYDGQSMKIYKNGILTDTLQASGNILDSTSPLTIGATVFNDYSWESFYGKIYDIRIYNRALSASEIQQLYQGQGTCSNSIVTFTAGTPAKAADVNANFDAHNCQIQALKAIVCQDHPTASICQ